ncbi:MAG: helix-turn-helix transcriptional regulator [Lachnospiraceae bacterium]|nr:helix-turn-helix transcriptional regulator [Lachnospiraceae bacterium]
MPYDKKAFGLTISRLRIQKGLTQERMSGLAGIARSHLVALENGEKTVRLDTLWRIADALEIRPSELIRKIENERTEG